MRILWLVCFAIPVGAVAQTPQELLRLSQETYKNPSGYEIKGQGLVQPAGSSWQVTFCMTIVQGRIREKRILRFSAPRTKTCPRGPRRSG